MTRRLSHPITSAASATPARTGTTSTTKVSGSRVRLRRRTGRTARCRLARHRSLEDPVALTGGSDRVVAIHFPPGSWRIETLTSTGRPSYPAVRSGRLQRPPPRSGDEAGQPAAVARDVVVRSSGRPERQGAPSNERRGRPKEP